MAIHDAHDKLEPGAAAVPLLSDETAVQLSIAISLKRIADALWGDNQNTGLVQSAVCIADRMSGPYSS